MDYQSPDSELQTKAPRLLDELNACPSLGGVCYNILLQSTLRAYRLGKKIEGIRFEQPVLNGDKIYVKANYSSIEGLYVNPAARQSDLERFMYKKNGTLAMAIARNPEYVKCFTALVEMMRAYCANRCKDYSRVLADNAGYTMDDVFFFTITTGGMA